MENTVDNGVIDIINTCFMVCMAFTILFFIISIILFFLFNIRTIFNVKTGRAQAKTVKEMQLANTSTGRLRVGGKTQTTKLSKEQRNKKKVPAIMPPPQTIPSQLVPDSYTVQGGSDETELLSQNHGQSGEFGYNEDYLQMNGRTKMPSEVIPEAETSVLNQIPYDDTRDIHFVITKRIVCVHTDEVIN